MSSTIKKELLELLKSDEEFRLAVTGLIGLDAIIRELKSLREDFNKLSLEVKTLREDFNRLSLEVRNLREDFNKLSLEVKTLREDFNRLGSELKGLREDFDRAFNAFSRRLDALGARWGLVSETAFREGLRGLLGKILGAAQVSKWIYRDDAGEVYGHPSIVEVDVAVRDDLHVLIEIKSSLSRGDVAEFWRIGRLYERVSGIRPRMVVISPYVSQDAADLARSLGIEIYSGM